MPQQGQSIGRDTTVTIIIPSGVPLSLGTVTSFTSKPDTSTQKIKGLNGNIINLRFPEGWSGSWSMERTDPLLDEYFAALEAAYYAGADETPAIIQQTIAEPDGSVSQYRYERALLNYDDAGEWGADKSVTQKLSFMAARRIQQA